MAVTWPPVTHGDVEAKINDQDTAIGDKAELVHTHTSADVTDFSTAVRAIVPTIRTVTADTVLALSDDVLRISTSGTVVVTVPNNTDVAFPIGSVVQIRRNGAGAVSVAAATGVTINGYLTGVPQYGSYALMKANTNAWDIEGGVA